MKTLDEDTKNWVEEVRRNHVSLRQETTGNVVTVARAELENKDESWHKSHRRLSIVRTLWSIGGYN